MPSAQTPADHTSHRPEPPSAEPLLPFSFYLPVKNEGSTARDNLANERTFLAWLRTGLSMVGLGLALAKFTTGLTSEVGGLMFVVVGVALIVYTGFRYFQVANALRHGNFTINVGGVSIIFALFLTVGVACLLFVLHHMLDPWEKR